MTNQFPTINSTLSTNGLCKLIQAQYGLSDMSECTIIRFANETLKKMIVKLDKILLIR